MGTGGSGRQVGGTTASRGGSGGSARHAADGLNRALSVVLDPAARRRGFAAAALLSDWRLIVGAALAARCQPVLLEARGGVLHLYAGGAAALEIQHAAPQLVERVNTYLGFRAVRRLRLVQSPLPPRPSPPEEPPLRSLAPDELQTLDSNVVAVPDPELRAALLSLGQILLATTPPTRRG